jgi:hypothetical protein
MSWYGLPMLRVSIAHTSITCFGYFVLKIMATSAVPNPNAGFAVCRLFATTPISCISLIGMTDAWNFRFTHMEIVYLDGSVCGANAQSHQPNARLCFFLDLYRTYDRLLDEAFEAAPRSTPHQRDEIARAVFHSRGRTWLRQCRCRPMSVRCLLAPKPLPAVVSLRPTNRCGPLGANMGYEAALYASGLC